MAHLVIQEKGQPDRVYECQTVTLIGRDDGADLLLPNVSVSRRHARIGLTGGEWVVEDLGSQNGIIVNGKKARRHTLSDRDTLKIGKFTCIFYADAYAQLHGGELLDDLPRYQVSVQSSGGDSTYMISAAEARRRLARERLLAGARLANPDNEREWPVGEDPIDLGRDQPIPVAGWYVWGRVARITWSGAAHFIERRAFWVPIAVAGEKVAKTRRLEEGEEIRIGGSRYWYLVKDLAPPSRSGSPATRRPPRRPR